MKLDDQYDNIYIYIYRPTLQNTSMPEYLSFDKFNTSFIQVNRKHIYSSKWSTKKFFVD